MRGARLAWWALLGLGCARIAAPPGGPPDFRPPQLMSTTPESLAVLPDFDGWVAFQFDEVVSEGGAPSFGFGSGGLERLVLISPDSGVPRVRWRRDRVEVRPRTGWRPNTVYRVELGAGLSDNATPRINVRDSAAVVTFTTGAPVPTRYLDGAVVDWMQRRFAPHAAVEAIHLPDSLVYRSSTDSTGRFRLGPLPDGEYLVWGTIDGNGNRRRDAREAWDTVRLAVGRDSVGEIWAFPRDTMPPRLEQAGASRVDSFAIALPFTQPLDPSHGLGPDAISILMLPDSTVIPVASGYPQLLHDSIYRPIDSARQARSAELRAAAERDSLARTVRDSLTALPDSIRPEAATIDSIVTARGTPTPIAQPAERGGADPAPRPALRGRATADTAGQGPQQQRPRIGNRLVLRLNAFLQAGKRYQIEVRGVRALSGTVADTVRTVLAMPEERRP